MASCRGSLDRFVSRQHFLYKEHTVIPLAVPWHIVDKAIREPPGDSLLGYTLRRSGYMQPS